MAMDSNVNDPGNVEEVNNGYSRAVICCWRGGFSTNQKEGRKKRK